MYDLARLGFVLVGLDIAISVCFSIVHSIQFARFEEPRDVRMFLGTTGGLLLLGLLPAVILVLRNRLFARYLFPEGEASPLELTRVDALLTVGIGVLGLYFVCTGAIDLVGSLVWFVPLSHLGDVVARQGASHLVEGLARIGIGVLIYWFAPRIVTVGQSGARAA